MTRILIVDDNRQNSCMLESVLRGVGYEVTLAKNGAEALELALKGLPDLVITDILMPVMDGYELCRRWKAHARLRRIPFIFYTATYTDPKDEQFGLSLGADRFVVKPAKVEVLQKLVTEVLEESRLGQPGLPAKPQTAEAEELRRHTEVMFRKLERKVEQLEEARAAAEAANRAKDDFLAIVSHELRTPLTAILGWGWLLRSGELSPKESQDAMDIILRNMQTQRQIVDDLLDMSSFTRGKFHLADETVELGAVLESACQALAQVVQDRAIRLVRELQGPAGVRGDAGRLQQVFWNLLHNAIKFSPQGGEVRVSLRREGDQAVVAFSDQGKGFPAEFLPHLFEPFRQGESPLIREHRGLGLGLAIVRHLVERHGGMVSAQSAGEGRGAVFTVRLPAAVWPEPGRSAPGDRTGPGSRSLEGLSVLVVEDETDSRFMLEQLLRRFGARVESAADAEAAWVSLQKKAPDLLLCDIALPGEDGCALMRRVRASGGALAGLRAAALTALARGDDRDRVLEAGFQTYLAKPLDPPQIVEALQALAGRRAG